MNVLLRKVKKEVIQRGKNTGMQLFEVVDLTLNHNKNFCADANNMSFIKDIFTVSCYLMNTQPTIVPQY